MKSKVKIVVAEEYVGKNIRLYRIDIYFPIINKFKN